MQYLDKLKKERPLDRVIFLAGMVLVLVGFLIPTVYVKDELPASAESTVSAAADNGSEYEENDYLSDTEEEDDLGFDDEVETVTTLKNIFGAAHYFNRSPVAYNATFLVIIWLCSIAGIALFFLTKSIIGDIFVVLIAIAFGIASLVGIAPALSDEFGAYAGYYADAVTPFFGYASVGSYLVVIGLLAALVGSVLGAAHIQHPDQVKAK